MQKLTVGLIGNPNSGKTTLFNQLTGARQRVGNWAGVTVERKEGIFATTDHQVTLVDLPGTYSLTTISSQTSLDEQIACHYILSGDADMLINVVDASNLERNLYLTLQLLELGIPCVVALNMLDIAEKQQVRIDIDALAARLGCPVIPLVSTRGRGIEALKIALDRHQANSDLELVHYPQPLLREADLLAQQMSAQIPTRQRRWLGLQMLEGDIYSRAYAGDAADKLDIALANLSDEIDDPALHIADARYQTIAAICDAVSNTLTAEPSRFTAAMDKVILNRFLGLPIFSLCHVLDVPAGDQHRRRAAADFRCRLGRDLCAWHSMAGLHPALPGLADRVPRPGDRRRYQHRAAAGAADRHDVSVSLLP